MDCVGCDKAGEPFYLLSRASARIIGAPETVAALIKPLISSSRSMAMALLRARKVEMHGASVQTDVGTTEERDRQVAACDGGTKASRGG